MIEILTLFLSLVTGSQSIELATQGPVARVELRLDGQKVAECTIPPWQATIDLGPQLLPHELVAVAYDGAGRELDRATRWINVDAAASDANLSLVTGDDGRPEALEIRWEGVGNQRIKSAEVWLDDQPIGPVEPMADGLRAALPAVDPAIPHLLTATLRRIDGEPLHRTTVYGGQLGFELAAELTAVVIELEPGTRLPVVTELEGWFEKAGQPLRVHGVEKGQAEILVVREASLQPWLDRRADEAAVRALRRSGRETLGPVPRPFDAATFFADSERARRLAEHPAPRLARRLEGLRAATSLGSGVSLRLVSTGAAPLSTAGLQSEMFTRTPVSRAEEGGLLYGLRRVPEPFPGQTADALALAGMLAHASQRRRAVVLLRHPHDPPHDASSYPATEVRRYFAALSVPLLVWELHDPELFGEDAAETMAEIADEIAGEHRLTDWPSTHRLGDDAKPLPELEKALADLLRQLDRQRVVWLEGRHLPGTVELGPAALGMRWVGEE